MWMIRAGEGAYLIDAFRDGNCVGIGWNELGDLTNLKNDSELKALYLEKYPDQHYAKSGNAIAMIKKFRFDMEVGDTAISYDPSRREYLVGKITSGYVFAQNQIDDEYFNHIRQVEWIGAVSRDALSVSSRNTLGSTLTIFYVNESVTQEFTEILKGGNTTTVSKGVTDEEQSEEISQAREDVIEQSRELIKDLLIKVPADDMERLVAGVLRAMGYRTIVSAKGPDRGVDVIASPDGLGLESPRIKVEVKHRGGSIGAPDVRSFIGGLRADDRGLYVSTGGFTKEAKYEADRANVPVTLIDIDGLLNLIISHYDEFDVDTRVLLPLTKVYWPK